MNKIVLIIIFCYLGLAAHAQTKIHELPTLPYSRDSVWFIIDKQLNAVQWSTYKMSIDSIGRAACAIDSIWSLDDSTLAIRNCKGVFSIPVQGGSFVDNICAMGLDTAYRANDTTIVFCRAGQCWNVIINGGAGAVTVPDIPSLIAAVTTSTNLQVTNDTLRGGSFNYHSAAENLRVDSGITFPAIGRGGGYWVRDAAPSPIINALWYGVSPYKNHFVNNAILQQMLNQKITNMRVPDNVKFDIDTLDHVDFNSFYVLGFQQVYTMEQRDSIKARKIGMWVSVLEQDSIYQLKNGLKNENWKAIDFVTNCNLQSALGNYVDLVNEQFDINGSKHWHGKGFFENGFEISKTYAQLDSGTSGIKFYQTGDDSVNTQLGQITTNILNGFPAFRIQTVATGNTLKMPLRLSSGTSRGGTGLPSFMLDYQQQMSLYKTWFDNDTTSLVNLVGFTSVLKAQGNGTVQKPFAIRTLLKQGGNAGSSLLNINSVTSGGSVGTGVHYNIWSAKDSTGTFMADYDGNLTANGTTMKTPNLPTNNTNTAWKRIGLNTSTNTWELHDTFPSTGGGGGTLVDTIVGEQTYPSSPVWTVTSSPPSGTTTNTYMWNEIAGWCHVTIHLKYITAGVGVTSVVLQFPPDLPAPFTPTGWAIASAILYNGTGRMANGAATVGATGQSYIRRNAANNAFEIVLTVASTNTSFASITLNYPVTILQ